METYHIANDTICHSAYSYIACYVSGTVKSYKCMVHGDWKINPKHQSFHLISAKVSVASFYRTPSGQIWCGCSCSGFVEIP